MMFSYAFSFAAAFSSPFSGATPPDIINIGDRVFATNADTLFVLRNTNDNLGVYTSDHTESFLVAIDIDSGEEQYWLVYRARRDTVFGSGNDLDQLRVTHLDRGEWHDPYMIAADAGAYLLDGGGDGGHASVSVQPGSIRLSYDYGPEFHLHLPGSMSRAAASLAALSSQMSDVDRMATITTRDLLENRIVAWDTCSYTAQGLPIGSGTNAFQIVRMHCHDGEDMEQTSLLQAVRAAQ